MKLLALDTSTPLATVAVSVNNDIYQAEQMGVRQHASFILPMIDRLMSDAGCTLSELDGIVFGRGPGSFTGIRIACSVVKGLAYAHDLPLFPVSSLAAIAATTFKMIPTHTDVLAVIDARMQQLYWGYFSASGEETTEDVASPQAIKTWVESMTTPHQTPFILAGVGFESYLADLPLSIVQQEVFPRATIMIEMVQAGKITAVSGAEALPVYIRNRVTQEGKSDG